MLLPVVMESLNFKLKSLPEGKQDDFYDVIKTSEILEVIRDNEMKRKINANSNDSLTIPYMESSTDGNSSKSPACMVLQKMTELDYKMGRS